MDEVFDLARFDEYREDNRLEVKRARERLPDALWETYSSFANTAGGCIILGVKENADKSWTTTGLKDVSKLRKEFFDALHNPNKVNAVLVSNDDINDYELNGDVILVIKVPKARREEKPVYINNDLWNGTYRRDGEGDYHCSREDVLGMLRDQTEDTPDMKVLENKEIKDFDQTSIRSYRIRYNASHEGHPWTSLPDDEFLVQIGAASDETADHRIHPTAAGLMMFGTYQRIMREFPSFLLDYYEKTDPALRWTDRLASHNGDWSGNLYDFYNKVYQRIAVDLKKPFRLDGIYRVDDTPVHVAVREALANCLSNADYYLPECVKIEKYPDRIVLTNPGTITLGKKQMLRGGKSRPRNKVVLNILNYIGVGERAGSGVPNIYAIWEQEGYLELHGDHVPVRLSVLSVRPDAVVVHLDGYDTVDDAQTLRGGFLCVDRAHAAQLPEYTYFIADLIGLRVSDTEGKAYGKVTDVLSTGANDVYVVDGGKLMVPALKKVIERVDVAGGEMVFKAEVLREVGLFAD